MTATPAWNGLGLGQLLYSLGADATQPAPGVMSGTANPALTKQTLTPSTSVIVTEAAYVIPGTNPAVNGGALWTPGADTTLALTAFDPTNPRIDLVCAVITDPGSTTTPILCDFLIVAGTPAAVPVAPGLPSGALQIAHINVPNSASSAILNSMIVDDRTITGVRGSILNCGTRSQISTFLLQSGLMIYEFSTAQFLMYTGTIWTPILGLGNTPRVKAKQHWSGATLTNQLIATATDTLVQFPDLDQLVYFVQSGTGNSRFAAQVAGWYNVSTAAQYAANGTGKRQLFLKVNGVEVGGGDEEMGETSAAAGMQVPAQLLYLAVGDYVEVWTRQESGGNLNLGNTTVRSAAVLSIVPANFG